MQPITSHRGQGASATLRAQGDAPGRSLERSLSTGDDWRDSRFETNAISREHAMGTFAFLFLHAMVAP